MKPEKLRTRSIALIQHEGHGSGHATGFFAEVENYGRVCITNAHVFSSTKNPEKLDQQSVLIYGHPAKLVCDGWQTYRRDVALVEVPQALANEVHYHRLGFSEDKYRLFYCIGWSYNESIHAQRLKKIYGLRRLSTGAPGVGSADALFWELQGVLENKEDPAEKFLPGWSGAPVFNVRPPGEEDHVIGILQAVYGPNQATAYAVQSLDFLRPIELQTNEGRTKRALPSLWKRVFSMDMPSPRYEIGYQDSYHDVKYEEIVADSVDRPQVRPPSPYDHAIS